MAAFMKRCIQFLMFPALLVPIIISYVKKTMMQLFTGHYKNWGEWNKCVCLRLPPPPELVRLFCCAHAHVQSLQNTSASQSIQVQVPLNSLGANRDDVKEPTLESTLFYARFKEYFKDYQVGVVLPLICGDGAW